MRRVWLAISFCACFSLAAACGGGGSTGSKCTPGKSDACVGPGNCQGFQICAANGTYGACTCGGGTAGTTGSGGSGVGGTGGSVAGSAGSVGTGNVTGTGGTVLGTGGTSTGGSGTGGSAGGGGTGGTGGGFLGRGGAGGSGGSLGTGGTGTGGTSGTGGTGTGGTGTGGSGVSCDPIAQTGCTSGQRCTWIFTTSSTGHNACLADGTVSVGGACSFGAVGEATGFDNCKKGTSCVGGVCKTICSPTPDSCPTNYACDLYAGAPFDPSGTLMNVGFCDQTCDPVTQMRADGAAACGSPTPGSPTLGCYGPTANGKFICAKVISLTKTQGMSAGSPPFINSCAPGFVPEAQDSSQNPAFICTAFCRPTNTVSGSPSGAAGLPASGYTCPDRGAASPNECRYYWAFFEDYTNPTFTLSPYSNTVGVCFNYMTHQYDSNGDQLPDTTDPSCTTLTTTGHAFDPTYSDAAVWGCVAHP